MTVFLFTPGDSPRMLAKASGSKADAVIADLEDGIAEYRHATAVEVVAEWASRVGDVEPWVRVRAGEDGLADARALAVIDGLSFVVPKVSSAVDLDRMAQLVGRDRRLIPLIETAPALVNVVQIAEHPAVERLLLGEVDLRADIGMSPTSPGWDVIRVSVVVASAVAGKAPPVAPPSTNFTDLEWLTDNTRRYRDLGFTARTCIHPAQLGAVRSGLRPDPSDLEWARTVIAGADPKDGSGVGPDGEMVDAASARIARRIMGAAGPADS